MKKVLSILSVAIILFVFTGVHDADAYSRSRTSYKSSYKSSSSYSKPRSSSYSKSSSYSRTRTTTKTRSYNLKSSSTPKKYKTTPKTYTTKSKTKSTSLTKKSTATKPKTSMTRKVTHTTTHKTTVVNNHKVVYKTKYVSPPKRYSSSYYNSHYSHSPYYHNGSFTNQLVTAAGVYLLLDHFDDDGAPVYVDSNGDQASPSQLNNAKPLDKVKQGPSGWTIFFGILAGLMGLGIIGYILIRILGRK